MTPVPWQEHHANDDTGPIQRVGNGGQATRQLTSTVAGELPADAYQQPHQQTVYQPVPPTQSRPWWQSTGARAGGLGLVALLSGLIWWGANSTGTPAPPAAHSQHQSGEFTFQPVHGPVGDTDCAHRSYGKAHKFFERTPCAALSRTLYSTTGANGERVLTSVSTVTMPSASDAAALKGLTDADGTGNVTDLVSSGVRLPGGPKSLKGSGYASVQQGSVVRIAESGFFTGTGHGGSTYLKKVSAAALQLQ